MKQPKLTLISHHLCPFVQRAAIALKEKGLEFELAVEKFWERREEFLALNPAGQVPVLLEPGGQVLADSQVIAEYLDEAYPERPLLGGDSESRAEVRRIVAWFDQTGSGPGPSNRCLSWRSARRAGRSGA